jgi:hypothetical protein
MIQGHIIPDAQGELRRREPRVDIPAEVTLRKLGSTAVAARLINLSSNGFMAETVSDIETGARVWLSLPGAPRVNALVVWSRGCRLGGEFAAPIDPLAVLEALGRAAPLGSAWGETD